MLPSHDTYQVGISFYLFEAQYPAHQCPCLRFDSHLTMTTAKLGVRMVRYSFPWAGPEFQWTVDWENLMKEKSHVHRKQTRFWGRAGSPKGD
jgi:hypothetical protein